MLLDWNHRVFKDDSKYRSVGKIVAAVAVYLRYAMGEETKDVKLTTVHKLYPIGERQVRKVITGKLYDTEGKRVEQIFTNMGRAYEGDPIDWNKEVKEAGEIEPENIMYEVTNKEGPDADLLLPGVQVKVKDIQPVKATVPKTKYFPRLPGQSPELIVHININKDDSFLKQLVQQVATSKARAEIYKQLGVEPRTTKGAKGEMSSEVMDEMISEGSEPLATRILGVAIKEEMADVEYIPYKTQKVMKVLTGKLMQMRKTIHEKAETEAEVVDLISSDEEMEDASGISTTAVKQEETEGDGSDKDNSDDDAESTGKSSEEGSDDEFGIKGLKEIYEEYSVGEAEQQMDTTEETKGTESMEQTGKTGSTSRSMIKVKKSEKPRVSTAILQYEPPVTRRRPSMMPQKTLSKQLLEQFEKLEAEELQEAKEMAKMARMTPKPKTRGKPKKTLPAKVPKILDPEQMETEDIEGPASGQITPGETSVISDMYTADMSMEEINLRNVLLELKKWKPDSLDETYSMLDHYCELQRIQKNIPDGDL